MAFHDRVHTNILGSSTSPGLSQRKAFSEEGIPTVALIVTQLTGFGSVALRERHEKEREMGNDFAAVNAFLIGICGVLASLCIVGALITFAMSQANDIQGGATSQKALMGFAAGAAACVAAAGYLAANPLSITF